MRKFKFQLDRKSLETVYLAFIRRLLEYADVTRDNCSQYKIQNEAARIAVVATKLVSLNALYNEMGLESLEKRRIDHKLTLGYIMLNNLTPQYLSSLVPPPVSNLSRYNLRNSNNLQTIAARTNQYFYSFLPSSIRAWYSLPGQAKEIDSINSFKSYLKKDKRNIPKHYYTGTRKAQILHTRLKTNCM